jgi:hypothetical protein
MGLLLSGLVINKNCQCMLLKRKARGVESDSNLSRSQEATILLQVIRLCLENLRGPYSRRQGLRIRFLSVPEFGFKDEKVIFTRGCNSFYIKILIFLYP